MTQIKFFFTATFPSDDDVKPREFRDDVTPFADALMDCLCDLDDVDDPGISFDATIRQMTIEFIASGDDVIEAGIVGLSAMRAALHADGHSTPGWEDVVQEFTHTVLTDAGGELLDA